MRHIARVILSLFLLAAILGCSIQAFAAQSVTARLPLVFVPNRGQAPADVRYLLREGALQGEFQKNGVLLRLAGDGQTASQVRMRLMGANVKASIAGGGALEGHTNYLLGNDPAHWLRELPNYTTVRYSQIYSGTDLVFYGKRGLLEHDFEVQPGADPSRIAFQLDGAESVNLDKEGNLRIKMANGAITFERPIAYQTVAGVRRNVNAAFSMDERGTVHFRLGRYDTAQKLVIDPVLSFATYLSSLASDARLIAADASGNTYVSGYATLGFPVTSGAFAGCATCTANNGETFVSKLSPDGASLIYSTVLGGDEFAQPTGIAVDGNGNVLVSGWTAATDFPTKNGQPIAPPNNAYTGFLISLSADGSSLNYGTMLGSPPSVSPAAMTYATAVAVDSSGNAYVTGETGDGFNTTTGALNQAAISGSRNSFDVFLAKFSPTGTLMYSAVLGTADPQNGGGGPIGPSALAVDAAGDAYVAGQAGTLWPISNNAYLSQIAGSMPYATPFVMEVAPDAKSVVYSTNLDYAYVVTGIAVLPNGNVFVAGNEAGPSYPTTSDAYEQNSGAGNAFLTELNSTGSGLVYSTVVGDSTYKINGIALDSDGDIWLAAQTYDSQFPLVDPIQGTFPASTPVSVVNELDPTGQTMKFSTFMGGNAPGYASSVAVDANNKVHVSGAAQYGMYTTPGVYAGSVPQPGSAYSESTYAYVALIDPSASAATLCLSGTGLSFGYLLPQTTATQNVQISNCGSAPLTFTSILSSNAAFSVPAGSNGCTGTIAVGNSCTVGVEFSPTAVQTYSGQLTITSNASIPTVSIALNGSGGEPAATFGPAGVSQQLVFSSLLVGQTSQPQSIMLYNNGPVPLTIDLSSITVTSGFTLGAGGNCTATLPANQYCWISVAFAPETAGTIQGTLSVSSDDPVHPTISTSLTGVAFTSYPVATITGLLNPSYPVNNGTTPITMSVYGTNFFPASVVDINGAAQTTSYQSSTSLTVTFSPSLLTSMEQIPVTVVNPTPGGGSSAPYPLIEYLAIPLTASALTVDTVGGLLYAAIPASAAQNANTVIPINPATGVMMTPISVASDPRALAVSDDGSELYVASAGVLQRFNLKTLALEKTFNLPVDSEWGQTYVQEMHVVPGAPQSVVVELFANVDPEEDGMALYNDSGLVNWIPGQSLVNGANSIFRPDSFTFTSASNLYAIGQYGESFFYTLQNSAAGLTLTGEGNPTTSTTMVGGHLVRSDGTLLYTNSGQVWDPSTQNLLGTYLEANGSQLFYAASVVPETANGHTYFLDTAALYEQYQAVNIDVYDQASYALLGTVPFTSIYPPDVTDLVRWGSNGFAFRCVDITGVELSANQIVIVTSDLVAPSSAAPVPILSSVAPQQVNAGGPAFTLQVTGSGFTGASTVLIDGNLRATTYVSGSSLTAQVLASDIAQIGQLDVQVTTPAPGGGTSNDATVSIAAPLATAAVSMTPASSTITDQQADVVSITVAGVSGDPTPTGTVTLSSGTYSAQQTLVNGAASIAIPPGTLSSGANTLTVAYSGDGTYAGASGTATVTVAQVAISAPAPSAVSPGGSATINVTLLAGSSYSGTMKLSCTLASSPAGAQSLPACGVSPMSVNLSAGGTASSVLTVTTTAASTTALLAPSRIKLFGLGGGTTLAGLLLIGVPRRRRRWIALILMFWVVVAAGAIGCGGGGASVSNSGGGSSIPATTAGTYTFSVTGTDSANSSITTTTSVSVTVQ